MNVVTFILCPQILLFRNCVCDNGNLDFITEYIFSCMDLHGVRTTELLKLLDLCKAVLNLFFSLIEND